MTRQTVPELLDVAADSVDKTGFFCFMSKKKSEGYQRKLRWLKDRFAEGMRIKIWLTLGIALRAACGGGSSCHSQPVRRQVSQPFRRRVDSGRIWRNRRGP